MSTQPFFRRWRSPTPQAVQRLLLGISALFVATGALTLYLADPAKTLTPWHLLALVVGWGTAWGGSMILLRQHQGDPYILPVAALLTGWGLLLLARLAPAFLLRQILWLNLGCAALCIIARIPTIPRLIRRYRYSLLAAGLLLLGATLVFGVNPSGYGQRLWLGAFGLYAQPSEPLKLLLVIYLAAYLAQRRTLVRPTSLWLAVLGPMLTMLGLALLLLGWQQDLGAALLFYLTFVAMVYLAWGKIWHVVVSLLLFAPLALAGTLVSSRVALRLSIWLNPWAPEQADRAFQIRQSLYALASGGLFGQGLGQGSPTLIPAVHTDFVYAALVEEFGLVGAVAMLILIGILVYRGVLLAQRTRAPFESLLAGGIAAQLAIQTWVIVGGNAKLVPITGVTLPFLSYGGSSLLTVLITTGLLLNLSAPHPEPITLVLPAKGHRPLPRLAGHLGRALLLLLASLALTTGVWAVARADALRAFVTNPRRILAESRIRRGEIEDRHGVTLASIRVDEDGYVTRTYPVPEAAPVVGYATLQYGTAGIEAACDARLRGDFERTPWEAHRDGLLHRDPVGRSVRLTLDARLQEEAQQLLAGHRGAAVLVDAHTGAILALASAPIYHPGTVEETWESLREDPGAPLLNRATQGLAQPGAILETVVLASALESGALPQAPTPLTVPVRINGDALTCAYPPRQSTWEHALRATCPAPFAALGERVGMPDLADAFAAWGLSDAPALEIPTVAAPWEPGTANARHEALGQGDLLVTPLQMVGVAAVLGNDGARAPLHLLDTPLSGCGSREAITATRVVSSEVAAQIRALWSRHGQAIGHQGGALAGPTRAQRWFIGLNSASAPRYAVAVLLDDPARPQLVAEIGTRLLKLAVETY